MPSSRPTRTSSSSASERGARHRVDPEPAVLLRDVSLRFVTYHEKYYSFKRALIDLVMRREGANPVTEFWALKSVSLAIRPGERLGIVGANGAGKSTLLRVLARIYPPTAGLLRVRGKIAPLIEMGAGFNVELSGIDNIYLNGAMLGFSRNQMRERIDRIHEFTELAEFAELPLKYYSSGMYSRLAFAIATEVDAEILLLDESLSAGDVGFVAKAKKRILRLLDRSNVVVIVSHDLKALKELCTRGLWMHKGQIIADGPIDEIVGRYTEFMAGGELPTREFVAPTVDSRSVRFEL